MKKMILLLLLLSSKELFAQKANLDQTIKKLALIVAVGDYPDSSGWSSIASINDIKYVKGALINKGFKEKDIDTLKNSKATKAAILKSLDDLVKKSAPNDIVVIHFSTHGQQIQDQATVEEGKDEDDGYDEAIIPVDACAMYNPTGYKGENHLRDDDLAIKFTAIRNKIKPNGSLLVLMDACHSGTASRAQEASISRGKPVPFEFPRYKADTILHLASVAGTEQAFMGDGTDTLSNMVVISASAPHQQNFQLWDDNGVDVGSLSFAFAKAMAEIKPGDDYQLLFEKIKARIQAGIPTQIPLIEGNTSQEVLGGKFIEPKEEIIVTISKSDKQAKEDSIFIINKGALDNVVKGSRCKIFIAGDKDPLAEGIIAEVGTFQSTGVANKLLKKELAYRAEMDEVSFGDFSTSVAIQDKSSSHTPLKNQVNRLFKPYQFISVKDNAELMLTIADTNGRVRMELFDRGDSTRWAKELRFQDTLSQEDRESLIGSIKNAIRVKYLRGLPDGGDLGKNFEVTISTDGASGNDLSLQPGDKYRLKIENKGKEDLFFSVVDIMPDNEMKVLIPYRGKEPQDFLLRAKQSRSFPVTVDAGTPTGKEIFKVFITKEPIDLRRLFDRKNKTGARSVTALSLEDMIDDTFKDAGDVTATRSTVSSVKLNEVGILTVGFTVKKQ